MIRVRIARALGSTPREEGAEMVIGRDRFAGTIGGGHLEYLAIDHARKMLARGEVEDRLEVALGPDIGQCCGGRVTLAFDDAQSTPRPAGPPVLIFGAGHVGRALATALNPLPLSPRLIDERATELALAAPGISTTLAALPEAEIRAAPPDAAYVILTHDHGLDFMLATEALKRGDAAYVGMIGSRTKRVTFGRYAARESVDTSALVCPIGGGYPRDKRPEVIAAFAAAEILARMIVPAGQEDTPRPADHFNHRLRHPSPAQWTLLRGRILTFHADPAETEDNHRYIEDGAILVENGIIVEIGDYSELADSALPVIDHRPHLIMPGLIDPHIHFPQVQVIASWGKQLLDWLNGYVFPEETRFADPVHAARMAEIFLDLLIAHGTTTACAFASVHPGSVDALFAASEARGMRMIAGKVMMDRNAPDGLRDTPERGYDETKALIARWHGKARLQYAITPRFAITSTAEQMKAAGTLASEHPDLHIQTHLSENLAEVEYTLSLYPSARDYLDVYEAHGLLGPRSLMGHAIHLRPREIARMAETGTRAVFCPTSNLFLGSGLFDAEGLRNAGVVSGVATDVGGGTHYSQLQTLNEAYKVLQLRGQALHPLSAFHWATRGNALALGLADRIGSLSVGAEADLVVLDSRGTPAMALRAERIESLSEELFLLQILGDDRAIAQTYVAGMPMKRVQTPPAAPRSQTRDFAPRSLLFIDEI